MNQTRVNTLTYGMGILWEYEGWLRAQSLSQRTIDQRVRFAEHRYQAWGTWVLATRDVALYLDQYDGWTRRTYHNHLNSLYDWLLETGQVETSPTRTIRRNCAPCPRPAPLTVVEAALVIERAEDPRLRAWLLLGALAGLRAHEIAKLRGKDICADSIYVMGKGGQAALVPTHPLLWELAAGYPVGYWFPSPRRDRLHVSASLVGQVVANHFRGLGLTGSIHRMRATYGTALLRNGHNIRVIQGLMRHRSLSSTEHYLGVSEDERRAAICSLAA